MPTQHQAEAYHRKLCRELGIQPARVIVVGEAALDGDLGAYNHMFQCILLRVEDVAPTSGGIKPRDWRWVLRHETHHHLMNQRGLLTATHYRGKLKADYKGPHSRKPWERAADRWANGRDM